MTHEFHRIRHAALLGTAAIALLAGSTAATAQQVATTEVEEIVVTGTLIRGIAPVGANVVGISRESIESAGVTDTQQLLGTMPQANTFLAFQNPGSLVAAGLARVPINPPNIRNLNSGSTGNPTTLVLMDGHRIVPQGTEQSLVDVGIVPTGIIQSVETILDGASSLYGSDAHGGVINFITRKRFDETKGSAQYGFADNYWSVTADITSGKTWDGGGFGITYDYAKNSPLYNKDRPAKISRNWTLPGAPLTGTQCEDHSTITASGQTFTANATNTVPGTVNCPTAGQFASFTPGQVHHGASAVLSQDLSDTIKFEMTGLYFYRQSSVFFGPFTGTETVGTANPYYRSLSAFGLSPTASQSVGFSYGPVLGTNSSRGTSTTTLWQTTPTLTVSLGDWQVRGMVNYGVSRVTTSSRTLDTTLQGVMFAGTTTATTNNPYNMAGSTNIAQIQSLIYDSVRSGRHEMIDLYVVGDGPLFAIPGGEVKGAVGAEYTKTIFSVINTTAATHSQTAPVGTSTSPKGIFGELNIPIVSAANARRGIEALTVQLSGRYDDYEESGTTFNPKVALTYDPVTWMSLRGNYGTSFRAPNAPNKLGGVSNSIACITSTGGEAGCANQASFIPLPPGSPAPGAGYVALSLLGAQNGIKPEKAYNWAMGFDLRPIDGLTISPTYWHISQKGVINIPSTGLNGGVNLIYLGAPQLITLCPAPTVANPQGCTAAQLDAVAAQAPLNGTTVVNLIRASNFKVAYISDTRTTNLGGTEQTGIDVNINYVRRFSWGSANASFNGAWSVQDKTKLFPLSAFTDNIATGTSAFKASTTVGATYGDFSGRLNWQHLAGYDFGLPLASTRLASQTSIKSLDIFNMSLRYNVNGKAALLQDLQLMLTVNNIFDTQPPISYTTTGGTINGQTIGRFVQFGISKKL